MECDQRVELALKMVTNDYIWVIACMIYKVDDDKFVPKYVLTGEVCTKSLKIAPQKKNVNNYIHVFL